LWVRLKKSIDFEIFSRLLSSRNNPIQLVEKYLDEIGRENVSMRIPSKKEQYAVRAIYELAKRSQCGPTKISDIADAQSIPVRFLEVILGQLKKSGLVASKRGFYGGYYLLKPPEDVCVGEVLRFLQKKVGGELADEDPILSEPGSEENPALERLWLRVQAAAYGIYDDTSMKDLLDVNTTLEK
jgi:Rrf2 family protein